MVATAWQPCVCVCVCVCVRARARVLQHPCRPCKGISSMSRRRLRVGEQHDGSERNNEVPPTTSRHRQTQARTDNARTRGMAAPRGKSDFNGRASGRGPAIHSHVEPDTLAGSKPRPEGKRAEQQTQSKLRFGLKTRNKGQCSVPQIRLDGHSKTTCNSSLAASRCKSCCQRDVTSHKPQPPVQKHSTAFQDITVHRQPPR